MFFEKLSKRMGNYEFKFSVSSSAEEGKIIVKIVPVLKKGKKADEVNKKLAPIILKGTGAELDAEIFELIGSSMEKIASLAEQVEGYDDLVAELSKTVMKDVNKDAKAKTPKETKAKTAKKEELPVVETKVETPKETPANTPVVAASRVIEPEPAVETPPVEQPPVAEPEKEEEEW